MSERKKDHRKRKPTAIFSCLARTKSIMESTKDSIAPVYELYAGFCRETTLHGLKHTVKDQVHWCERFLWFVLTLSAFFGAVYCALSQLSRYNVEPVVVSMQRDYRRWWSTFPAVTACFTDRVEPDKAKLAIEMNWNVTEESDPTRYAYYAGFIDLVTDVSFRSNLQNFWKYQNDESVRGIDLLQLALSVHPTILLKVMVSDSIKEVFWMPVMTEVGMCLTFNSMYARFQFMLPDLEWHQTELHKCHYHSGQCYVRIDSVNNGVRYFVHSPFEISTAISNPTGEVMPGEELIIDFKAVEIQASPSVKKLRPDQRRCHYPDEWISDSVRAYSFGLCQMHCRNRMALMFCGCRPFFYVKGVLPFGIDVGLLGVAAYYLTRLKKPQYNNVVSIFGPEAGSKESELHPEKVVRCIAHRGAGLDAPENTLEAFKYCVDHDCYFVELDVRSSRDGQLVLLHDQGLERLAGTSVSDVRVMDWESIKNIDIGATHPNRHHFKEVHLCLLDDALDYLLEHKVRMIIDVKGEDKQVINGILNTFSNRPSLYQYAAVTCFNPFVLYQIRKKDPQIVGAVSYRPYCFSAQDYDAENGPNRPRYGENLPLHAVLRLADALHSLAWRWAARWCGVSAVLLHKDVVSPAEVQYWRSLGIRCAGWCVNRPLEKLYWRGVLKAPYLANTLLGEPDIEKRAEAKERDTDENERAGPLVDKLLEPERRMSSGQN
ncbi:uncharacterized protein LOC114353011 isoform X1 [Ostrinia furnacalis]|uniref:uncharacterized protein LOC114353011 isoform X1 n=1 Tax=Ostrinia furnacalis TaxID=93504 RepID=UPI0010400F07|nr:uncharacterized protein LOC114353011 isoform X1 [Ostrinia furnacalis]XP_028160607.1 uncharacterized protein LOC114353011 isoform X1 [Ostrinia furnacalis]